jgi:TPR repeat protein
VKWYRKAADHGNAIAQSNLGLCYYNGNGVTKDYAEAVKWYRKAADQGNVEAQFNLGCLYYFGHGVQIDKMMALSYWEKAAEKDHAVAVGNLGALYANGVVNGKRDNKRALYYYNKAIEIGNAPEAYSSLSYYYEYGIEVEKDIKKAEALLEKGASIGSYYCSGRCLYDGIGRKRDYRQAFLQFRKSVDENDSDGGRYYLEECYANGYGTIQDVVKAVQLYARAAEREHIPAMKRLAECYETGTGEQKDLARAKYWYQKAADEGSDEARAKLDELGVSTPSSGTAVETFTVNDVSFNMVRVEGGSFMMGDEEKEGKVSDYSKPAHTKLPVKFKFLAVRSLQTGLGKDNPDYTDYKYWKEKGWIDKKRPWK